MTVKVNEEMLVKIDNYLTESKHYSVRNNISKHDLFM